MKMGREGGKLEELEKKEGGQREAGMLKEHPETTIYHHYITSNIN